MPISLTANAVAAAEVIRGCCGQPDTDCTCSTTTNTLED